MVCGIDRLHLASREVQTVTRQSKRWSFLLALIGRTRRRWYDASEAGDCRNRSPNLELSLTRVTHEGPSRVPRRFVSAGTYPKLTAANIAEDLTTFAEVCGGTLGVAGMHVP